MKKTWITTALMVLMGVGSAYADKPNIVLINADDLGWGEVGCYGQKKIKTPQIDSLAKQGQRWTSFYSGSPVCAPSRCVLMTGRHVGKCEVQDLKRVNEQEDWNALVGDWPISAKSYTLPEALKKAGYTTAVFGKWGLGEYGTGGAPDKHGIDRFYGYTDHRMCHTYYPPFLWSDGKKIIINNPPIPGHIQKAEGEVKADDYRSQNYASDLIADQMVKFVDAQSKEKPFFLYYAPLEPHVSIHPPQKWVDMYPKEWDEKPYRGQQGYLPNPRVRAAYAGMISHMDDNVGKIVKALKAKGLYDNTLIIFTSDNGATFNGGSDHKFFNSVQDLKGLKGLLYEGGIRVPGIMVWNGKIKPGEVVDQPAYGADIMPTLCAIAGADAGEPTGENLTSILEGKTKALPDRSPLIWGGGGYGGQVAVRLGDMKVMRRQLFPKGKPTNWEVYNIKEDPKESKNIAAEHRDLIEKAETILKAEYQQSPDFPTIRFSEPETK